MRATDGHTGIHPKITLGLPSSKRPPARKRVAGLFHGSGGSKGSDRNIDPGSVLSGRRHALQKKEAAHRGGQRKIRGCSYFSALTPAPVLPRWATFAVLLHRFDTRSDRRLVMNNADQESQRGSADEDLSHSVPLLGL
jgi:hypothetical protein